MTRLIKFNRSQYPDSPDWLNPDHIRVINFDHELACVRMVSDDDFYVTKAEAQRLIAEINGTAAVPAKPANVVMSEVLPLPAAVPLPYELPAGKNYSAPGQLAGTGKSAFLAMLATEDWVVLDTETTGLERGEIVQIAIADKAGNVLLNTLVKPVEPIPADATRIHGITDEMVKDAPTWEAVRRDVFYAIAGRHVVIYNAVYDRKMMHQSAERRGMVKLDWKDYAAFWCAMEAFAEHYGDFNEYRQSYRWQKLSTAARHYGIEQKDAHTALDDVETTRQLCLAMAGA